jgi:hypothetical protein
MIRHEVQPVRPLIMSNLPKQALGARAASAEDDANTAAGVSKGNHTPPGNGRATRLFFRPAEVYGAKSASRRLLERAARPSYARRATIVFAKEAVPKAVPQGL